MNKELNSFEMDLAAMDMKAARFKEAEERYINIAKQSVTAEVWLGIGNARFGRMYLESLSVTEVFECFNKAIQTEPERRYDIEILIIRSAEDNIIKLKKLIQEYSSKKGEELISGMVSDVLSWGNRTLADGEKDRHTRMKYRESQYDHKFDKSISTLKLKTYGDYIKKFKKDRSEIIKVLPSVIEVAQQELEAFKDKYDPERIKAREVEKEKIRKENEQERIQKQKAQKEIEIQEILNDPNSKFHVVRKDAIDQYNLGNFKEALLLANSGIKIYNGDAELNDIASQSKSQVQASARKKTIIDTIIWVIILVVSVSYIENASQEQREANALDSVIALLLIGSTIAYFIRLIRTAIFQSKLSK